MRKFGVHEEDSQRHNTLESMSLLTAGTTNCILKKGGIAGIIGWVVTYPADVVKTRQQSVEHEMKPRWTGFWANFRGIARTEGVCTLYRGLGAACLRAFPTNAVYTLTTYLAGDFLYGVDGKG